MEKEWYLWKIQHNSKKAKVLGTENGFSHVQLCTTVCDLSFLQLIKLLVSNKHSYVVNNSNFICLLTLLWAKSREILL